MAQTDVSVRRLRRKERKRLAAERRPLAWRRAYRAAQEVLEQGLHLWKMADNKTRLALTMLGPLNALLLLLIANTEVFEAIPERERMGVLIGVVVYAVLAVAMFLLCIGTLRPERAEPDVPRPFRPEDPDAPLGVRHYEDVLRRDID